METGIPVESWSQRWFAEILKRLQLEVLRSRSPNLQTGISNYQDSQTIADAPDRYLLSKRFKRLFRRDGVSDHQDNQAIADALDEDLEQFPKPNAKRRKKLNLPLRLRIQGTLPKAMHEWKKKLNRLLKICSEGILPRTTHIQDPSEGTAQVGCFGGSATVFKCLHNGAKVAVKVINAQISTFGNAFRGFCREAVTWKHLRHPNIVPFLGASVTPSKLSMVSVWMDHGNIMSFTAAHPDANRIELLMDVTNGLTHMHNLNITHGDLKGANILVNKTNRACITDFGLSAVTHSEAPVNRITSFFRQDSLAPFTPGGTYRWMSPELLSPEEFGVADNRPTRQSDRYALGMVIYEVLSDHSPYYELSEYSAVAKIIDGERPKKPTMAARLGFTGELWEIVERCWNKDRDERPNLGVILSTLKDAVPSWKKRKSTRTSLRQLVTF